MVLYIILLPLLKMQFLKHFIVPNPFWTETANCGNIYQMEWLKYQMGTRIMLWNVILLLISFWIWSQFSRRMRLVHYPVLFGGSLYFYFVIPIYRQKWLINVESPFQYEFYCLFTCDFISWLDRKALFISRSWVNKTKIKYTDKWKFNSFV